MKLVLRYILILLFPSSLLAQPMFEAGGSCTKDLGWFYNNGWNGRYPDKNGFEEGVFLGWNFDKKLEIAGTISYRKIMLRNYYSAVENWCGTVPVQLIPVNITIENMNYTISFITKFRMPEKKTIPYLACSFIYTDNISIESDRELFWNTPSSSRQMNTYAKLAIGSKFNLPHRLSINAEVFCSASVLGTEIPYTQWLITGSSATLTYSFGELRASSDPK